ncbi:hypothetical protein L484_021061 [Morus notabilis]|uniref:Uncharacterized protein n=1 Tax=Morus notabilis TaxID=981085 RepID=W9R1A2_9ROSA|nr:hypothetical protein L484_021061 [Morus notabilis]
MKSAGDGKEMSIVDFHLLSLMERVKLPESVHALKLNAWSEEESQSMLPSRNCDCQNVDQSRTLVNGQSVQDTFLSQVLNVTSINSRS